VDRVDVSVAVVVTTMVTATAMAMAMDPADLIILIHALQLPVRGLRVVLVRVVAEEEVAAVDPVDPVDPEVETQTIQRNHPCNPHHRFLHALMTRCISHSLPFQILEMVQ
jgi:hypothetical protein